MNALQLLFKGMVGMVMGINLGAVLGGVIAAAAVGPEWIIGGMVLGAMAGSLLGSAAGFLKGLNVEERAPEPRPAMVRIQARHATRYS